MQKQNNKILSSTEESKFIISMRKMVAGFAGMSGKSGGQVFLITSAGISDGKSTLATILTVMLAREGKKILFISEMTNLDKWGIDIRCEYEKNINGNKDFNDMAAYLPNLYMLGINDIYCTDIYNTETTKKFFERAGNFFDLVIVDSPSVHDSPFATFHAPCMDGVILVAGPDTGKNVILSARKKIETARGRVLGCISNRMTSPIPSLISSRLSLR